MIKKWISLFLCGVCSVVYGEDDSLFIQEPKIRIVCNQGVLDEGYSRLTTNVTAATFNGYLTCKPMPKEEWEMGEPQVIWRISPDIEQGEFSSSGYHARLKLGDADHGKSYKVEVEFVWTLINKNTRKKAQEYRSATYALDAVFYWFMMYCTDQAASMSGSLLVDNHSAQARVFAEGCSRLDLLDLSFTSKPNVLESPVNKKGTKMEFIRESPLVFQIPKTYWYGLKKPKCCYTNEFPYEITLRETNDGIVEVQQVCVGMPRGEPAEAKVAWVDPQRSIIIVENGNGYKAIVNLGDFKTKVTPCKENLITDQYKEETLKEESYHIQQLTGKVSWEKGGELDVYSAAKIRTNLLLNNKSESIDFYSREGENSISFSNRVVQVVKKSIEKEKDISKFLLDVNYYYRELKAKEYAGYNAAWMYHCTYEKDNAEANIIHKTRTEIEDLLK